MGSAHQCAVGVKRILIPLLHWSLQQRHRRCATWRKRQWLWKLPGSRPHRQSIARELQPSKPAIFQDPKLSCRESCHRLVIRSSVCRRRKLSSRKRLQSFWTSLWRQRYPPKRRRPCSLQSLLLAGEQQPCKLSVLNLPELRWRESSHWRGCSQEIGSPRIFGCSRRRLWPWQSAAGA